MLFVRLSRQGDDTEEDYLIVEAADKGELYNNNNKVFI